MVRRIVSVVIITMLLCGCSLSAQPSSHNVSDTNNSSDAILIDEVSVDPIDVSGHMESIIGVVKTTDGSIVVAGLYDHAPRILLLDMNGSVTATYEPEDPAAEGNSLLGICENTDGGYTLYFETALISYDITGTKKHGIDISQYSENLKTYYFQIIHITGRTYAFRNENNFFFINDNQTWDLSATAGNKFVSAYHKGQNTCVLTSGNGTVQIGVMDSLFTSVTYESSISESLHYIGTVFTGLPENGSHPANNGLSLYDIDASDGIPAKLFDWSQTGLPGYNVTYLADLGENRFLCSLRDESVLYMLRAGNNTIEKKLITVAGVKDFSFALDSYVSFFNANNDSYYAEIIYYDYEDTDRLKAELLTGQAPDVITLGATQIQLNENILTDLLPFVENDDSISRDDFFEPVFSLSLVNGKMLYAFDTFEYYTLVGRSGDVGDRYTWNMEDARELFQHSDHYTFNWWMTPEQLMGWAGVISLGEYVDLNTMTCDFENDSFISLMEFCKLAGNRLAPEGTRYDFEDNILLTFQCINSIYYPNYLIHNYGTRDISYIGFPNNTNKPGACIMDNSSGLSFAIPESTQDKQAAWTFVRAIYSPAWLEYDTNSFRSGFPMTKSSLDASIENALSSGEHDMIMTRDDIMRLLSAIEQTDSFYFADIKLFMIIQEESASFFSGAKTAEEAAHIIQSRISLYLSEQP